MDRPAVKNILEQQRRFFAAGATRELSFRIECLKKLRSILSRFEQPLFDALRKDLHKPPFESYGGETALVIRQIDHALGHIRRWTRPERVRTPFAHTPATAHVQAAPLGVVLIISPWNFPIQLALCPLVGALAAGNCAVIKPSPLAPETGRLLRKMLGDHFDPAHIAIIEGGAETAQDLLEERFDHIFFTGGTATGRLVMQAAAKHLTPVTLELGGKNPCIVDGNVDLEVAARRIAWGKFFNAGQSCVAVDYLLVDRRIKRELVKKIAAAVERFYGSDPASSEDYIRIVNSAHVDRLASFLDSGRIVIGGTVDRAARYIAPTILDSITGNEPVMADEIFGPLLPVIEYGSIEEAITFVNARPKPLALYFFSRSRDLQERVLRETSSGGVCINDTVIQETMDRLPFGGVGESGMGAYHGKAGFDAFSHQRSIVRSRFLFDVFLRYPPYKDHLRWLRRLF